MRKVSFHDTIYGWINISTPEILTSVLKDFACSKNLTNIDEFKDQILLFPNPLKSTIYIKTPFSKFELSIYDQFGKTILQCEYNSKNVEVDLSRLANCLYFLKITSSNKIIIRKILKQ